MNLKVQKRIAGQVMKCSPKRANFDTERLEEIKEAITKEDIKRLISSGAINKVQKKGVSRARARKILVQKRKGRQRNKGSLKGKQGARLPEKENWMNRIRLQRAFLQELKAKSIIDKKTFRMLYLKSKGGLFRSKRHLKLYIDEQSLAVKKQN
jgi:large subunit ribosomal protein L19e